MKQQLSKKLELKNILLTGRIPFKRKLSLEEVSRIITQSNLNWSFVNEERSPSLHTCIDIDTLRPNKKIISISIGISGNTVITGVKNRKDAYACYDLAIADLLRFVRNIIDEDKLKGGIKSKW